MKSKWWHNPFFYLILLIVAMVAIFAFVRPSGPKTVATSEFVAEMQQEQVDTIMLDNKGNIIGLKDNKAVIKAGFGDSYPELREWLKATEFLKL